MDKSVFGFLSLLLVLLAGVPYIRSTLLRKTKPHFFTWFIWGILTAIAAAGQQASHAGPGAWATWLSAVVCFVTAFLALFYGEKNIVRSDWVAFIASLLAIPLWIVTETPLYAILLVTLIDAVGFYPTLRKSFIRPGEEMVFSFVISNIKHLFSFFAMIEYSVATLFNPAVLFMMNMVLILMILWRRQVLARGSLVKNASEALLP